MTKPQYRYGYTFNEAVNMHESIGVRADRLFVKRLMKFNGHRLSRREVERLIPEMNKAVSAAMRGVWPWDNDHA